VQTFSGRFSSHLPAASTKGFACVAEDALVVAIAGTEPTNIFNWIDDFNIHKTAAGVTDGFLDAFESVAGRITELISGAGGVFFAGHSLGAAIAAIAAKTLVQQGKLSPDRLRGIYTIGMPRIGNAAYAQAYENSDANVLRDRTFRLVTGAMSYRASRHPSHPWISVTWARSSPADTADCSRALKVQTASAVSYAATWKASSSRTG
jgi:hypothetical protein